MDIIVTILAGAAWALLGVLGLVLFLLNMPYLVRIDTAWDDRRLDGHVYAGWPLRLLGVVVNASFEQQRVTLYLLGLGLKSWTFSELVKKRGDKENDAAQAARRSGKKTKKKRKQSATEGLYLMRMPYKRHALKQVARWFHLQASLKGRFGGDDPYVTAQAAMALSLVRMMLPTFGRDVTLDYIEPAFEGRLALSATVWVPRILLGAAVFLLSRKGRAMVRYYSARPKTAQATQTTA